MSAQVIHVDLHLNAETTIEVRPVGSDYEPFATLDIYAEGDNKVIVFVHDEATVELLENAVARLREVLRAAHATANTEELVA